MTGEEAAPASERVPAQLPSLPSVEDISRAAAYASDARNLDRIRGYVAGGRPVWWRRGSFQAPFRNVEPKWHILVGRTHSDDPEKRGTFTWHGLCGFQNEYTELLGGFRDFKVTTPKMDARCRKCAAALKEITATNITRTSP